MSDIIDFFLNYCRQKYKTLNQITIKGKEYNFSL